MSGGHISPARFRYRAPRPARFRLRRAAEADAAQTGVFAGGPSRVPAHRYGFPFRFQVESLQVGCEGTTRALLGVGSYAVGPST
jgi:hypothetical protein